jgi:ABC-2 type transport system ATP-binding protein
VNDEFAHCSASALRLDKGRTTVAPTAIRCEALERRFNGTSAVDGVDLDIAAGEIYGFLGPNGAGKSTTVRMLCTLLAPTSGRATVAGFDLVDAPGAIRLRIGVALQEAALDPRQTGAELLMLQGRLYGLPRAVARRRVQELGDLIDLGPALHRRIRRSCFSTSRPPASTP